MPYVCLLYLLHLILVFSCEWLSSLDSVVLFQTSEATNNQVFRSKKTTGKQKRKRSGASAGRRASLVPRHRISRQSFGVATEKVTCLFGEISVAAKHGAAAYSDRQPGTFQTHHLQSMRSRMILAHVVACNLKVSGIYEGLQ